MLNIDGSLYGERFDILPVKTVDSTEVRVTTVQPFRIHGARGSIPVCGKTVLQYGGETTCFSVETDDEILIIDAGTGIVNLGAELASRPQLPRVTLLFTHFHLDHVVGLPSFALCYRDDAEIRFMTDPDVHPNWRHTLETLMGEPFWPANLTACEASLSFDDLPTGDNHLAVGDIQVRSCPVPHPQGCVAYHIGTPRGATVVATDVEFPSGPDDRFLAFCDKTDVLIYDAQYTPGEVSRFRGWGHSTWQDAVTAAKQAGAAELVLTHHAPTRTDEELKAIEAEAAARFEHTRVARPGMELG